MFSKIILAALPLLTAAAPAPEPDFMSSLARRAFNSDDSKYSTCDISAIKMDSLGLAAPAAGLQLDHIALGRGVQNYTCANDTAKPAAAGAVAILYNVTCLAGPYPGLLNALPAIALKYPIPTEQQILDSEAHAFLLGHHYFTPNATTPFFNLNTVNHQYGMLAMGRLDGNDMKDPTTNVQNLQLGAKSRDNCKVQQVYRLNSAGGQAPKTCAGMPKEFSVQYATEYWFWSDPAGQLKTGAYGSTPA